MSTSQATVATSQPSHPRRSRPLLDLFVISFVILFFELACIRWFGATVIFLTFFTNLVLMACILGMSVGCLAAGRKREFIQWVLPLTLAAAGLAWMVLSAYEEFSDFVVEVGSSQSPQQVYFGTEYKTPDPSKFVLPIEVVAGAFFALIALMFVGMGQVLGRCFDSVPDRVKAYTVNIAGSLVGIVMFAGVSLARLPPPVWFGVAALGCLWFARRNRVMQAILGVGLVGLFVWFDRQNPAHVTTTWSPYYKVEYNDKTKFIDVNNIGHQKMFPIGESGPAYMLPYLLNRDAGNKSFDDVMIIGAGSGNDVQAALNFNAKRVDGVEIEPLMSEIGRDHHPNRPYDDPRVHLHFDDGRSFVRKTDQQFDLAIYALVDSLVLHSGYSSIRLESFLFTEQAMRDIRARLKPDGVFAMYNFYRQGWVVGRLVEIIRRVFETEPLVISLPYNPKIAAEDTQRSITFVIVGNQGNQSVEKIRQAFAEKSSFWIAHEPKKNLGLNAFGPLPPPGFPSNDWLKIGPAQVNTAGVGRLPTDDWPFLYLREPKIPALNFRGMAIVGVLSLVILFLFAPVRRIKPNPQMFLLGAGFMLLETKGVVHMALLFGSTWFVNSIVFFAILIMVLFSNLYVIKFSPRRLWPYSLALIALLVVNMVVPMTTFLALPGALKTVVSCLVIFLPVFFAGVVFASSFRVSTQPDVDFGSNIGGVILGGLCEFVSLMLGFNNLLIVAIAFYALAMLFAPRLSQLPAPAGTSA